MHRGLSSVMMNYARSISDEKKAKTVVKGNKIWEKLRGVVMTCRKNSSINVD